MAIQEPFIIRFVSPGGLRNDTATNVDGLVCLSNKILVDGGDLNDNVLRSVGHTLTP